MRRHRNFIIIGAVFLSLCVASLSLVAAAQASLPGDRIYAVKLSLERLRVNLAPDAVTRARLDLAFLATRLDELQQVRETVSALIALDEVSAALAEATRAIVALPAAAQGDMRAELARLALRVVDVLTDWKTAGGSDPQIDRVIGMARALAKAAANPNVSAAELLLALDLAPTTRASMPVAIAARTVSLPPELMASHQPPFSGRHAEISCNACHVGGKTVGMSAACTACHTDPHEGRFEKLGFDCTICHTDVDFKPSTFDHVNFPDCQTCHLVDAPVNHFPGQCSNCHTTQVWKPADFNHSGFTDCVSCHTQQAPPNHFPGQCSNCHNTSAWKPANFSHSGFTDCVACHSNVKPVNHFPGQCSNCHNTSAWKPASFSHNGFTDCVACHSNVKPANHFAGQCSDCHSTSAWKPASFDHAGFTDCVACHSNRAPANHFPGQCSNCHNTSAWKPASFDHAGFTSCASCHTPPGNHFPGQCSDCHNTGTWSGATFNHTFPIDHHGANADCATCHPGGDAGSWTCAGCHEQSKMDEKHKEIQNYSDNCVACHADGKKPKH